MSKIKKEKELPIITTATIGIRKCEPKSFMNLHTELGSMIIDDQKVRFCQHINGVCF